MSKQKKKIPDDAAAAAAAAADGTRRVDELRPALKNKIKTHEEKGK